MKKIIQGGVKNEFTRSRTNYCNDYSWNYFWQKESKIKASKQE